MRFSLSIAGSLLALLLAGCEPKARFLWSPDGSQAAVLLGHGLFLADAEGTLGLKLAPAEGEPTKTLVEDFTWLADGSGLVIHRLRVAPRWEELRGLAPESEMARVEALAERMPGLLGAAAALHGDADRAEALLARLSPQESHLLGAALRLAAASDHAALAGALDAAPRARAALSSLEGAETGFVVHELILVRLGPGDMERQGHVLATGFRAIKGLAMSPTFPVLACAFQAGEASGADLEILALDGSFREAAASAADPAFAWTPDGRSLVYLAPLAPEETALKRVRRSAALSESGAPLPPSPAPGQPRSPAEDLALAAVPFSPRLAVLPDGSILFAGQPLVLPAGGDSPPRHPRLYLLPPGAEAPVAVPAAEGALPMDLGYFAASPDGRRVAVVESGTDAVAVIELESGRGEIISGPHPGWKCRALPAWRTAGELTFAALDPASGEIRWQSWRAKGGDTRTLSASWPAAATADWMEKPKPLSQEQDP